MTTCILCGEKYDLGYTGVREGCDSCLGIERDANGSAWYPWEQVHIYEDVATGALQTVSRADAFVPLYGEATP